MLGFESASIAFVWIATVLSGAGCVVFGALMWNKGGEDE
ncbi:MULTISPECIES: symporter small accessory protein [Halobacillus]